MKKVDVVRQYRDKHPDFPNAKLARIIYKKEGLLFPNENAVRLHLIRIEGKGSAGKKKGGGGLISATHLRGARPYNPYKLPESDETKFPPFILRGFKNILLLGDIHAPYHSIEALTVAINYAKKQKVDCVLINGDLFDFHGISKYMKDPRKKNFAEEIRIGTDLLIAIRKALNVPIYFKLGNHDERYQHYLWTKAGEISGLEDFALKAIIDRRIDGVTIIEEKRIIKIGALNVLHGHEFASSIISPVNIARGLYLRAKANAICGHHHRTSEHTEQNVNGKIITCWSTGCLSELNPAYMPINSWNHGFAIIEVEGQGFHVHNKKIIEGQVK